MIENDSKSGAGSALTASSSAEIQSPAAATVPYDGKPDDLHDLFGGSGSAVSSDEEDPLAALRNDPNYSALIRDLEYIASQARLLFAPAESTPSDDVWTKIQSHLPAASQDAE